MKNEILYRGFEYIGEEDDLLIWKLKKNYKASILQVRVSKGGK